MTVALILYICHMGCVEWHVEEWTGRDALYACEVAQRRTLIELRKAPKANVRASCEVTPVGE